MGYDIYKHVRNGNDVGFLPIITIPESQTDIFEIYNEENRLDKLANDYYNNPTDYKLILMANPKYSIEFDIPIGTIIRIPFPKDSAILRFQNELKKYQKNN